MPDPRTCQIRKTKPIGPLTVCDDLPCFIECYRISYKEKYGSKPIISAIMTKDVILEVSEEEVKEQYDSMRVDVSKITTHSEKELEP